MSLTVFLLIGYIAGGIVFIARTADQYALESTDSTLAMPHSLLRLVAGLAIGALWPIFLIDEKHGADQSPMAIKLNSGKL